MSQGPELRTSALTDLVFHVLSLLPLPPDDCSRLFEPAYSQWVERHFPSPAAAPRTLPEDADLLVELFGRTSQAFRVASLAVLFRSPDELLGTMAVPFEEIAWPTSEQAELARCLADHVPLDLIELMRTSLWSEARAGYLELRERHLVPLYQASLPGMRAELAALAPRVRGLGKARIVASHPLRRFGRVLREGGEAVIAVGLPHEELDVPAWAPVFQACHEHVVGRVSELSESAFRIETRAGSAGHADHWRLEIVALSVEARLLGRSHRELFSTWARQWLPESGEALAAALPWSPRLVPSGTGLAGVIDWLASGAAVPEDLTGLLESATRWFLGGGEGESAEG